MRSSYPVPFRISAKPETSQGASPREKRASEEPAEAPRSRRTIASRRPMILPRSRRKLQYPHRFLQMSVTGMKTFRE